MPPTLCPICTSIPKRRTSNLNCYYVSSVLNPYLELYLPKQQDKAMIWQLVGQQSRCSRTFSLARQPKTFDFIGLSSQSTNSTFLMQTCGKTMGSDFLSFSKSFLPILPQMIECDSLNNTLYTNGILSF